MYRSVLIRRAKAVFQVRDTPKRPLRSPEMQEMPAIEDAFLLIEDGVIRDYGPDTESPGRADITLDAAGRYVLPCWCDSHSHIVYAASRENEFVDRIRGLSYEEIARRGGGILNSAGVLRGTSEEDLYASAWARLQEVVRNGTGALEVKSGYGLDLESELKMLRVIRRLKDNAPIPVKATFLGAHAVPPEFRGRRVAYVRHVIQDMLPRISAEGLADYIDVFCDKGFFTPADMEAILEAGARYSLKAKIHVNQLSNIGGLQVGVKAGALSVDHLEAVGDDEIAVLSGSQTIGTLLPSCAFFLNIPYPPARKLIDSKAAIALASDYNPGSTPSGNMPFVISLACIKMRMLPEEAINAATLNGAFAMEVQSQYGSLARGKMGHVLITRPIPSLAYLPYAFGSDHIEKVVLKDTVVEN